MPAYQPDQIGPLYDFGISTRDGSFITVKNKDGKNVQISRLGYMAAPDKQNPIKEATELQEKERLVQLGSSNLIDREFDQWPQVTQGDWSGGLGQRVFGVNGDTSRYYDGEGLLWPTGDWIPQKALRGPYQPLPQGGTASPSAPDSGTETAAPGGSQTVKQAALALASLQASGLVAQIGVLGAYATGTNTAVTPAYGQATGAGRALVGVVGGQRAALSGSSNLGETAAATSSFDFSGVNSDNVIGTAATFTVPAGGIYVNSISIYMGGHTAAVNAIFAVWNASTGALLINSGTFSCAKTRSLKTKAVNQTFIAAGTVIRIGFWRQQNQDAEWGVAASGSFNYHTNTGSVLNPTTGCTGPYVCGHLQAYISYQTLTTADIVISANGAGWVKLAQQNTPDGYYQTQIWAKPNSGAGDPAPTWSATAGATPMHARLSEWSNLIITSPPTDQTATASNSNQTSITATAGAIDAATGDLVVMAGHWDLSGAATASFTKSFNNNISTIDGGDSGAASVAHHDTFAFGIVPSGAATFSFFAYNGTAGGFIDGLGMGYAVTYLDNQGTPHWHAAFFAGDQYYDADLGSNAANKQGPLHMHIAGGYLWILFSEHGSTEQLSVRMVGCAYASNTFTQLRNDLLSPTTAGTAGFEGLIQAALVGGKMYVAVLQADADQPPGTSTANHNALYVLDYSGGTAGAPTGIAAPAVQFPFLRGFKINDLCWQGNNLVLSVGDGFNSYIYSLGAPFSTVNTEAVIPGISNAFMCAVGSTLFIVAWTPTIGGVNRMNLYTLDGSTLNDIPFTPIVPFLDSVTSPVAFGNYAFWGVSYPYPAGPQPGQVAVTIYAYDVVNGRTFRAITFTDPILSGNDVFGHDVIGVYGVTTRTQAAGATFQSQIGLALFTGQLSNAAETAQEFYWGVSPITPAPTFSGLLQLGVDITSGIIDFTAATNKLFRALLSHFANGLVTGQSSPFVTLNVWFNQDPAQLPTVPDFTISTGTPPGTPPVDLTLFTNQVTRKLVYQVISDGGGFNGAQGWQNSAKIIDVIIQAATGWVFDAVLDLGPTVKTNAANVQEYAYQHQSQPGQLSVDHVAAYNFLRLLWRQKGGQILLVLPNGDSYPALIQQMEFSSPKPFAASYRSDQQSTLQQICSIKIREDI